jgi:hypothetical protein
VTENLHDVHEADSADAKRKRADKAHQNFQSQSDDFKLMHLGHDVGTPDGLLVLPAEFLDLPFTSRAFPRSANTQHSLL